MTEDKTTTINSSWIRSILKEDDTPQMDKPDLSKFHALLDTRTGELYPITHYPFRIGRSGPENPDMDLSFDDIMISHTHAHIIKDGNQECIVDDGSTNGTYVNGKQLNADAKTALNKNDDIRLANIKLIYL